MEEENLLLDSLKQHNRPAYRNYNKKIKKKTKEYSERLYYNYRIHNVCIQRQIFAWKRYSKSRKIMNWLGGGKKNKLEEIVE